MQPAPIASATFAKVPFPRLRKRTFLSRPPKLAMGNCESKPPTAFSFVTASGRMAYWPLNVSMNLRPNSAPSVSAHFSVFSCFARAPRRRQKGLPRSARVVPVT